MLYVHIAEPHHRELPECAKGDSNPHAVKHRNLNPETR